MRVGCPHCHAAYNIDDRRVPAKGLNVRCPKCRDTFPVRPAAAAGGRGAASGRVPVPLPATAAPVASAVPLAPPRRWPRAAPRPRGPATFRAARRRRRACLSRPPVSAPAACRSLHRSRPRRPATRARSPPRRKPMTRSAPTCPTRPRTSSRSRPKAPRSGSASSISATARRPPRSPAPRRSTTPTRSRLRRAPAHSAPRPRRRRFADPFGEPPGPYAARWRRRRSLRHRAAAARAAASHAPLGKVSASRGHSRCS